MASHNLKVRFTWMAKCLIQVLVKISETLRGRLTSKCTELNSSWQITMVHRTRFRVSINQWNNSCWIYWAISLVQMRIQPGIRRFSYKKKRPSNQHKARHLLILHWSLRWRRRHISPLFALLLCIFIIDLERRMSSLVPGGYWAAGAFSWESQKCQGLLKQKYAKFTLQSSVKEMNYMFICVYVYNTEDFCQLILFSSFFPYLIWHLSPGRKVHPPSHGMVHLIAELCAALSPRSALVCTQHLELLSASSGLPPSNAESGAPPCGTWEIGIKSGCNPNSNCRDTDNAGEGK